MERITCIPLLNKVTFIKRKLALELMWKVWIGKSKVWKKAFRNLKDKTNKNY